MPNVSVLLEYPSLNGGERSLLACIRPLREAGFSLQAIAPRQGPLAVALRDRRIDVAPLSLSHSRGHRLSQAECRQRLCQRLERLRPDLIHANSLAMSRLVGPVAEELGIPSVGHLRDIGRLSRAAMADVNRNRRLLCVSRATLDWFVPLGLDEGRSHVVYNGVDLAEFSPRSPNGYLHRELKLPSGSPLLACIGQVGMRKGLDVVLQAAGHFMLQWPEVHLLIVGQRHSEKEEAFRFERQLRQDAGLPPLRGRVHFLGRRDDIAELLGELTLLIHAARQEPLGRVLLEAAAVGVPIVATDVGGTAEIFPPESSAADLIPPQDAIALSDAVSRLLTAESGRYRLSRAARSRMIANFDARLSGRVLSDHYRAALASAD